MDPEAKSSGKREEDMRKERLLGLSGAVAMAAILAAAGPALGRGQAPMLDALVQSGDLPPLEERLPANPLVVSADSIGTYGGTWRMGLNGGGDNGLIVKTVAYESLVRYDHEWKTVIPNLAESWEVNAEATEFTFKLREGVKWSDGTPFTTADIAFAVEMYQDPDYAAGSWIDNKNNPVSIEVIDDFNFKFIFGKPNGMFMETLAGVDGIHITSLQKAYCSQFPPSYNENAAAEAEAKGFSSWALYLQDRCAWGWETIRFANPDLPTIYGWVIEQPLTANAQRVTWTRNPYFWKVDAEGNQLPYIDALDMRVSQGGVEELTLAALNGEIDFQERHIATNTNKPLFFDGQEAGGYHLGEVIPSASNTLVLQLNLNHLDPVKRELYQSKDFRVGISHAIDRQEIIDVVFTGQGEPFQVAPRPESAFYDEELAKQIYRVRPGPGGPALRSGGAHREERGRHLPAERRQPGNDHGRRDFGASARMDRHARDHAASSSLRPASSSSSTISTARCSTRSARPVSSTPRSGPATVASRRCRSRATTSRSPTSRSGPIAGHSGSTARVRKLPKSLPTGPRNRWTSTTRSALPARPKNAPSSSSRCSPSPRNMFP